MKDWQTQYLILFVDWLSFKISQWKWNKIGVYIIMQANDVLQHQAFTAWQHIKVTLEWCIWHPLQRLARWLIVTQMEVLMHGTVNHTQSLFWARAQSQKLFGTTDQHWKSWRNAKTNPTPLSMCKLPFLLTTPYFQTPEYGWWEWRSQRVYYSGRLEHEYLFF